VIQGHVTEEVIPIIMLPITTETWPAVIDTGFNGDLELPVQLRALVNPRFLLRERSFLAGGQTIVEDVFLVDFPFDGQMIAAEATFAPGGEILIGTHFLRQYRLTIDFVARTVILGRVG